MEFSTVLIDWYQKNKRNLPWRDTTDPYKIWISEIILQQTRVSQGLPYYHAFITQYPTISDLAMASEKDILILWQGLGYYSRARNLHEAAKNIHLYYHGIFPSDYSTILSLKGIGEYTAAAIASFAFKLPHPVLDGNVYRFISRLFGIEEPIDTNQGKKKIQHALGIIFDQSQPDIFNQAIMEFGALQCVPKKPVCDRCAFSHQCIAYKNRKVDQLPYKRGRTKVVNTFHTYFFIRYKENTYIEQRTEGIWKNLYQFPMVESLKSSEDTICELSEYFTNNPKIKIIDSYTTKHLLSHRKIYATFYTINLNKRPLFLKNNIFEITMKAMGTKYPLSILIQNFMKRNTHD